MLELVEPRSAIDKVRLIQQVAPQIERELVASTAEASTLKRISQGQRLRVDLMEQYIERQRVTQE